MTLITEAERAEDIVDALSKFKSPLPDQRAEIVAIVAELSGLSRALREINDLSNSKYSRNQPLVQEDLDNVCESIDFTLEDVWLRIGSIGHGAERLTPLDYRTTWKDIHRSIAQSGKRSLVARLELYKLFLEELGGIMRRRPVSQRQIDNFRFDIKDLLSAQDRRMITINGANEDLSLTPVNKRSYEREREPSSPTSSRDNSVPPWVTSPPLSPTPLSPTTSFSATFSNASRTSGSVVEMGDDHWVSWVFRDLSVTPLEPSDEEAICHGEVMPDALAWLEKDKMEQLLKIGFGDYGLHVYVFVRESDHRARILCETPERSGNCWYSCMPFNRLYIRRNRSVVILYNRVSGSDTYMTWAVLPFTSMERLVLFYNTCLALRAHDPRKSGGKLMDQELNGERCPFAGQIIDDGYRHALRVYRDHYSKAIRLQASVIDGELKNTPVWTAFVTDLIPSRHWIRREGSTVFLRTLKRHIFAPRYSPSLHENGEPMLEFINKSDAKDFEATIEDLARAQARR